MIECKITGDDLIERYMIELAAACPAAATAGANAGAELVAGFAKEEGFRTVGEAYEHTFKSGKRKGQSVTRRKALGKPIEGQLTSRSGDLRSSITYKVAGVGIAVAGPTSDYGGIHEFGGTINMGARSWRGGFTQSSKKSKTKTNLHQYVKRHTIGAYQIKIPARPYMGPALANHLREVREAVVKQITRVLGRGA